MDNKLVLTLLYNIAITNIKISFTYFRFLIHLCAVIIKLLSNKQPQFLHINSLSLQISEETC